MRTTLSQQKFLDSAEAVTIHAQLLDMMNDKAFNTTSTFSTTREDDMPFDQKHMTYLSDRPKLNPQHYLANLRLMTRLKK